MSIDERLKGAGVVLPPAQTPAYNYVAVVVHGDVAYVSGQIPREADGEPHQFGKLGAEVDLELGRRAARLCILQGLSVLNHALGSLDRVERVLKIVGFVASAPGFNQQPQVMDAASQLLIDVFGEAGRHARSAVGVAELPRNVPVEIELVVAVKP